MRKKYYLSEIAEMINNLGEHKVNIIKKEEGIEILIVVLLMVYL